MNDAQKEKAVFVKEHLTPLLIFATDHEVRSARYMVSGADERVEIRFSNGYVKSVNVTMDSLAAIVRDVMKRV